MAHDQLLYQYIRSDASPTGQWHVDVPSGLTVVERQVANSDTDEYDAESFTRFATNRAKEIDAVCIRSQPEIQEPTRSSLNHDKARYVGSGVFDDEEVFLVEAKTSKDELFKGLGQLEAYSTHFQEYWTPESVEKLLVLLGAEADAYIEEILGELPVRLVDIPDVSALG